MNVYEFSVTIIGRVRVSAASADEASATIRDAINGSDDANLGAYPNGDPILATVCVEGDMELESVDGEPA